MVLPQIIYIMHFKSVLHCQKGLLCQIPIGHNGYNRKRIINAVKSVANWWNASQRIKISSGKGGSKNRISLSEIK